MTLFRKDSQGFTMLELSVAAIIVGIILALAIPQYQKTMEKVRSNEGVQVVAALVGAQKRYKIDTGVYADSISVLDVELPQMTYFSEPGVSSNPAEIAWVRRKGDSYYIQADSPGRIYCWHTDMSQCPRIEY